MDTYQLHCKILIPIYRVLNISLIIYHGSVIDIINKFITVTHESKLFEFKINVDAMEINFSVIKKISKCIDKVS